MATASAPASSANLGPGFDCLALALELRCTVTARPSDRWELAEKGPETAPHSGLLEETAREAGEGSAFSLVVGNAIPVGRGLGASAAARAAIFLAVKRTRGEEPSPAEVLSWVAEREGHADNAAAAVHGGLVAVGVEGTVASLEFHPSLRPVVAVPDRALPTPEARRALPTQVAHQVAVRNLARVVFLVEGLRTGRPELLAAAEGDELHEPHRNRLHPQAGELQRAARQAGALLAVWSGAGTSVLALTGEDRLDAVVEALGTALAGEGRVLTPTPAVEGLR